MKPLQNFLSCNGFLVRSDENLLNLRKGRTDHSGRELDKKFSGRTSASSAKIDESWAVFRTARKKAKAMERAVESGIVNGYSDSRFGPNVNFNTASTRAGDQSGPLCFTWSRKSADFEVRNQISSAGTSTSKTLSNLHGSPPPGGLPILSIQKIALNV